jgi:signal transduction histidine kinase
VLTICWVVGAQEGFDRLMAGSGIPVGPDIVPMTVVVAWLIGHSIRQAHVHAEQLRAQADAQAATAERLQIARELHDMVAHSIGVIAIQAGMGSRVIATQPAEAGNALAAIEVTSRQALAGLREMLGALRRAEPRTDSWPAPTHPAPGLADLGRLAATTLDAGIRVDVQWRGDRRPLPAEVDLSAFRIVQEAVTNVIRHAGTRHCQVFIDCHDEELSIEVTDDGRGARNVESVTPAGYGITGMRERAGLLGGQLNGITEREREVLTLIGRGMSNSEIASHLFISMATVKAHVARLLTKLGARDRVQLVITAYEARLVSASGDSVT